MDARYFRRLAVVLLAAYPLAGAANDQAADERASAIARYDRIAASFHFAPEDAPDALLERVPNAVLTYTNPVRMRGQEGAIYLWTRNRRPAVIGSIWSIRDLNDPSTRRLSVELHSLSQEAIHTRPPMVEGRTLPNWMPPAGAMDVTEMPGGNVTGTSAAVLRARLRQAARRFEATVTDRKRNERSPLRLMSQPIYQYSGGEVLAGCLFAFVLATDPEIFMLLEARRADQGAQIFYGFARMTGKPLSAEFDGAEVWSAGQAEIWTGGNPYYFCVSAASFAADAEGPEDE